MPGQRSGMPSGTGILVVNSDKLIEMKILTWCI